MGEARKGRRGEKKGEREVKEGEEGRKKKRKGRMLYMWEGCSIHTYQVVLCPGTMNSGRCIIGVLVKESGEVLSSS